MDWIHCNACYMLPSSTKSLVFFITNCGHLFCHKCLKDHSFGTISESCLLCKKPAQTMEINSNLKGDARVLFSNPKDVVNEFVGRMKMVVDFQQSHRSRLLQYQQSKLQKASKWIKSAQIEIGKRGDQTRHAIAELDQTRYDLDKEKQRVRELENRVAEREQEVKRLRINRQSPFLVQQHRSGSVGNSLNSTTDSFIKHQTPTVNLSSIALHSSAVGPLGSVASAFRRPSSIQRGNSQLSTFTPMVTEGEVFPSLNGATPLGTKGSFERTVQPMYTSTPMEINFETTKLF